MDVTQELAQDFFDGARMAFAMQTSATPCIYQYQGEFGFSYGTVQRGVAMCVYQQEAVVVVDTCTLREYVEGDKRTAICHIYETLKIFAEE